METDKSWLWTQEPMISAPPIESVVYFQHLKDEELFESAVFKLENNKYLYISFCSDCISNNDVGITDYEEFDVLDDALMVYKQNLGEG